MNRTETAKRIVQRDGKTCCYCGKEVNFAYAGEKHPMAPSIEHVVGKAWGGSNALPNLKLAHRICNAQVGDLPVIDKIALMAKFGHTTTMSPTKTRVRVADWKDQKPDYTQPEVRGTSVKVYLDKPGGWVRGQ